MKIGKVVNYLTEKYKEYNIPIEIITKYSQEEDQNNYDDAYYLLSISKRIEYYIVNKIKTENNIDYEITIIDKYSHLKFIIKKNKEYLGYINDIAKAKECNTDVIINKIYEDAIEQLSDNYNMDKTLGENILYNMMKILSPKIIDKQSPESNVKTLETGKIKNEKDNIVRGEDIIFLKDWLIDNEISIQTLANYLGIGRSTLSNYLSGKTDTPKDIIDKLVKLFGANDYTEFRNMIISNKAKIPEELIDENLKIKFKKQRKSVRKEKRYDISFLKNWLTDNEISVQTLANYLGIGKSTLSNYLSGKTNMPESLVDKLINLFSVKDYEELKTKIINNELKVPKELIKKKIVKKKPIVKIKLENIDNINQSVDETNIGNSVIDNTNNEGTDTIKRELIINDISDSCNLYNDNILDIQKMVNAEYILSIIDLNTISKLDYIIINLLFGGINGKYYGASSISNFTKVDVKYIYNILINCLELYKKSFDIIVKKLEDEN